MADASSLTLADYALQSNDPLIQKIGYSLIMAGNVLQDIPLQTYPSFKASGVRFAGDNLATVNWRALNADPAVTKSTPTPFEEQAYTLSNSFDIDSKLLRDQNAIQNPFSVQLGAYLRAVSYDINDKFINNTLALDPNAPVGLRFRIDNATAWGVETELKIDAGGVTADMSAAMTATTANAFLEVLQQLLDYMGAPDGVGVVIYVNDLLKRRLTRAIRVLGAGSGFALDGVDPFQRKVLTFQNAVIRDIGRKKDQSTRILLNTEASTGVAGSSTFCSLYGVRFGLEDAFRGWQFDGLEQSIIGPFLLQNGVQQRLVIDWTVGWFQEHTRAIGRVYDIKIS